MGRSKIIILDFSQIVISNAVQNFKNELKKGGPAEENSGLIKHMVLSSILAYKKKFGKEYGEIVLAIDNKNYWRKKVFQYYKAHRARNREESNFDWELFYKTFDEVKQDLRDYFPYKLVEVESAEADDVIACLCKYLHTNELKGNSLFSDEAQPIIIVSADTDFVQLQKYKNVKQWSPMLKKFVGGKGINPETFLIEHICTGDTGDGIPNIMSADNCIFDKVRQKSFMKARMEDFIRLGIDACKNDEERARFQRNQRVIDFEFIPEEIYSNIIKNYTEQKPVHSSAKIMNYMLKNKMKLLMGSVGDF